MNHLVFPLRVATRGVGLPGAWSCLARSWRSDPNSIPCGCGLSSPEWPSRFCIRFSRASAAEHDPVVAAQGQRRLLPVMRTEGTPSKRAPRKGGTPSLLHAQRARPALHEHERSVP